jgi:peptidoglycan/LPS O-acetylase OafA/YrhL
VGVDVFFVISGYLITSILCLDCEAGRFSLTKFYQRRIARLFPAFFTVALFTLAASWIVYNTQDFASAGVNLVAASLSLANVKYMFQGNYFEISPDAQPFLHYWSLSVEEQFYLFFPITLFVILRYARLHTLTILSLLGVSSLAGSVLLTQINPVWAFYLPPTRAWQLTAGCLIAVIPFVSEREIKAPAWVSAVGLCLIAISFLLIKEGPHFPGIHRYLARNWSRSGNSAKPKRLGQKASIILFYGRDREGFLFTVSLALARLFVCRLQVLFALRTVTHCDQGRHLHHAHTR